MIIADIKGKLSINEDYSEDFLTSCVFSILDLLPNEILKNYLEKAININGKNLRFNNKSAIMNFWPRFYLDNFNRGIEPDLIISSDSKIYIIEVKFHSGKSGAGFNEEISEKYSYDNSIDQLSLEYFLGKKLVKEKNRS